MKIKNNIITRQFTIYNNGSNSITIDADYSIVPVDRIFFKGGHFDSGL